MQGLLSLQEMGVLTQVPVAEQESLLPKVNFVTILHH